MASTKGLPLSWAEQKPNPVGFSPRKPSLVCGQDRQAGSLPGEGTGWCWWLQEPQPRFPCGFRALSCCQPWPVALKPQMALAPGSYCPLTVAPWGATVVGDIDRCRRGASVKATVSAAWAPAPQPGHQPRGITMDHRASCQGPAAAAATPSLVPRAVKGPGSAQLQVPS